MAQQAKSEAENFRHAHSYVLEEQVGHLLRRAHQRHSAIFQNRIGEAGLTQLQFAALVKLRDLGNVSQNELGRHTAMDAATMQGVIKRLAARGLIERTSDPEDRRRLVLCLNKAGRDLVESVIPIGADISAKTLAPLTAEEQEDLVRLLAKISG